MMRTTRGNALGFALGAAVGVTAGILLAPASGEVTRLRMRRRGEETLDRGREAVRHTKENVREKVDEVRHQMTNLSEVAHSRLDAARNAVAEGKAAYRREMDGTPLRETPLREAQL